MIKGNPLLSIDGTSIPQLESVNLGRDRPQKRSLKKSDYEKELKQVTGSENE